ncbi:DgyrCDS10539 [Dimorphilus gyrociliatus]|uniref:DgyrCDS10539 n=1 Tax=Dimorphilus gyrociliatus TaxID=2664684 RepID=A0A7I8W0H6_9ANNE|nr:DgyrCDS10539 [Dimorphilus gyrociliatus]
MSSNLLHKTVFILDHGESTLQKCGEKVDFDGVFKHRAAKNSNISPLPPIEKTLWSCNVESVVEYCRIAYDVLPYYYLIRVLTCDDTCHVLNDWNEKEQNTTFLLNGLAKVSVPRENQDANLEEGVRKAMELISQPSPLQLNMLEKGMKIDNTGRVIIFSSSLTQDRIDHLEDVMSNLLGEKNRSSISPSKIRINHIDFEFVSVRPVNEKMGGIKERSDVLSKDLNRTIVCTESGQKLAQVVVQRCIAHYDLGITSVTGIPMKEEQNAASSTNYDVELLHSRDAHSKYCTETRPSFDLPGSEVVGLKWVPPKSSSQIADVQPSRVAYRVTPVDVNSRPSSCLTNFILSGRSVLLEHTHSKQYPNFFLAAHSGVIYIHSTCKCPDIPGISEGAGGRLTDYRIHDFGEFMMGSRLVPESEQTGLKKSLEYMDRCLRYWPLTQSESLLAHQSINQYINPLQALLSKANLTPDVNANCFRLITQLFQLESSNELIPQGVVAKGKREEQIKQFWCQFEKMLRCYSSISENHKSLLDKFLSVKGNCLQEHEYPVFEDSDDVDKDVLLLFENKKEVTLWDVYMTQNAPKNKRLKFEGILDNGKVSKLYPSLQEKELNNI